jgi:hypothetical protein
MMIILGVKTIISSSGCKYLRVGMAKTFMYIIDVQSLSSGSSVIWSGMISNPCRRPEPCLKTFSKEILVGPTIKDVI